MPRVTGLWFTALNRVTLWRSLCIMAAPIITSILLNWLFMRARHVPLPQWAFILLILTITFCAFSIWRWIHWHQVMKENIFHD